MSDSSWSRTVRKQGPVPPEEADALPETIWGPTDLGDPLADLSDLAPPESIRAGEKREERVRDEPLRRVESPAQASATAPATATAGEAPPEATEREPAALEESGEARIEYPTWSASSLRPVAAAASSAIVHLSLILVMGLWFLGATPRPPSQELVAEVDETPSDQVSQFLAERLTPTMDLTATDSSDVLTPASMQGGDGAEGVGASLASGLPEPQASPTDEGLAPAPLNVGSFEIAFPAGRDAAVFVPEGTHGEPVDVVDGYEQAMDRITQEILQMLTRGKVLVIWCFDQSESMKDDRDEIRARFDKVYDELQLSPRARGDALLTAIASYGSGFMLHTEKPTSNVETIREAIASVPIDPSGDELMCQAALFAIGTYRNFATSGHRQLAVVLVTDESGDPTDNRATLEAAVNEAISTRCKVYSLGREAVFGYRFAHMAWVDPETQIGFNLPVDRGPETPYPEQLQIDGFTARYDAHPSGFGPYEQARLARETGGVFFMLPGLEANIVRGENRRYEIERMRPYLPDLRSRDEYAADVEASELRRTLYDIVLTFDPYDPDHAQNITLRTTFSIDPQAFLTEAREAQRVAEGMVVNLHAAEESLDRIRHLREQEADPRWQANYDLLYAQILAYKVRTYEYGAYLEAFIQTPKLIKNPLGPTMKTNYWGITTRAETITGDLTSEYIERANLAFQEVIANHPGTPWAARAESELARGSGIDLVEGYSDPRAGGVKLPKL